MGGFSGTTVTPISAKAIPEVPEDPVKLPAKVSTAAGRLKSLEQQSHGDEKLRKQQWAQAYMSYRSAADAAGDRGSAHFRLAFTFTAMKHYSSAVREFRRGLFLDPTLPLTGVKIETLFGPESQIVRTSILHKVADWVRTNTSATALFIVADEHNSPIPTLAGRRVLIGYPGWLWTYGLPDYIQKGAVETRILKGDPAALDLVRRYGVDYVMIGPQEIPRGASRVYWDQHGMLVYDDGGYAVYRVLP